MEPNQKQPLQTHEAEIAERYKGLSVDCLLCHFDEKRPTLKDVSSLIAICINLGREIDKTLHTDLSKPDIDAWLEHYGLTPMIDRVKLETKPEKQEASIRRLFQAQAPLLYESYMKYQATT